MKKSVRITMAVLIVLVIAIVAVRVLVPADSAKVFLLKQLDERTGIIAEAEQARIQFPWPVGVRLKKLSLKPGPKMLPSMPRVKGEIDEVLITADLVSLLKKKPHLKEITLKQPRLEIWLPASGGGGEESTSAPSEPKKETPALPPALALALLSVRDGQLTLHQADGGTLVLQGLTQRVHGWLAEDGSLSGRLQGGVEKLSIQRKGEAAPRELYGLSLDLLADGKLQPLKLHLQVSRLEAEGWRAQGPVELSWPAGAPRVEAELDWAVEPSLIKNQAAAFASTAAAWKLKWDFQSLQGSLKAEGTLPGKDAAPREWLDLFSVRGELQGLRVSALGHEDLLQGNLDFVQKGDALKVQTQALSCPGWTMHGGLDLPVMGEGSVTGHFEGKADARSLHELAISLWPQLPESLRAKSSPPSSWPAVAGQADGVIDLDLPLPSPAELPVSSFRSRWTIRRLAVVNESLPDSLFFTQGSVDLDAAQAQLSEIAVTGPGLRGVFGGRWSFGPQPRFTGVARFSRVDLDSLRVRENEKHASVGEARDSSRGRWWKTREARAEENALPASSGAFPAPPKNLSAEVDLRCDRLFSRGYRIDEFRGHLSLQDQVMELRDLAGDLDGGRVSGDGQVNWTAPVPHWKARMEVDELSAKAALAPLAPGLASALNTVLKGQLVLDGPLDGGRELVLSQLSGRGDLGGSAGKLLTGELLASSLSSLPQGAAQKLREIPFQEFLARLHFEKGRALFDEALLKGPTQVRARGWVGFDGSVDTHLEVKLPVGESLDLGSLTPLVEFLRTSDGRITIPVRIEGNRGKPQLSLELDTAQKHLQGEAKKSVKDQLRGLLKGLGAKKGGG